MRIVAGEKENRGKVQKKTNIEAFGPAAEQAVSQAKEDAALGMYIVGRGPA